jgi:hypothetical protein
MGNRTVVVLYNDQTSEWEKDPLLGRKIMIGMNDAYLSRPGERANLGYGRVVECTHADNATLAIVEGYRYNPIAHSFWRQGQKFEDTQVELLRAWADKMGYRLVKKPTKESHEG